MWICVNQFTRTSRPLSIATETAARRCKPLVSLAHYPDWIFPIMATNAQPAESPKKRALPFKRTVVRKQQAVADARNAGDDSDLDLFRHSKEVFSEILRESQEAQALKSHGRKRLKVSVDKSPGRANRCANPLRLELLILTSSAENTRYLHAMKSSPPTGGRQHRMGPTTTLSTT